MTRRLRLDRSGASAVEFALVLPLLLILLFGIIDAGRYIWDVNQAEKATQYGARTAVVTDPLAPGLTSASYVGVTPPSGATLTQGDVIPASALGVVTCTSAGCSCTTTPCPTLGTMASTNFTRIADRMRTMKPDIADSNVVVTYSGSGLGYAGDPNGMEISPLVTVQLSGVQFKPVVGLMLRSITLPAFRTTLTAEDSAGTGSN